MATVFFRNDALTDKQHVAAIYLFKILVMSNVVKPANAAAAFVSFKRGNKDD